MLTIHKEGMKWQGGRLIPAPKDEAGVRATMACPGCAQTTGWRR